MVLIMQKEQKILVFDLGGGTFDISLIEIADGVIDVLSTSGDNFLGGDDFDERIVEIICREIKKAVWHKCFKGSCSNVQNS